MPFDKHQKHTSWIFTINTYTYEDIDNVKLLERDANVLFAAYECEARPHIQGFITFKKGIRFNAFVKLLPRAHVEPARGGKEANRRYILDGENTDGTKKSFSIPFLSIERSSQGTRTDLASALETARTRGIKRCAEEHPETFVKFHRGIDRYIAAIDKRRRTEPPTVYWLYGHTGIGKTHLAYALAESPEDVFEADAAPKWFCGLNDHNWVIFDEYDKTEGWSNKWVLRLTDKWPVRVEQKGGSISFTAANIVFTSSVHPQYLFPPDIYEQVWRRLDYIGTKPTSGDPWEWEKMDEDRPDPNIILFPDEYTNENLE